MVERCEEFCLNAIYHTSLLENPAPDPVQQKDCKRETIQLRRPRPGRAERSQGPMTMTDRVVNRNRKKYKFLSGRRCKQAAGRRNRARDSAQTDHIRQVPRWRSPLLSVRVRRRSEETQMAFRRVGPIAPFGDRARITQDAPPAIRSQNMKIEEVASVATEFEYGD